MGGASWQKDVRDCKQTGIEGMERIYLGAEVGPEPPNPSLRPRPPSNSPKRRSIGSGSFFAHPVGPTTTL